MFSRMVISQKYRVEFILTQILNSYAAAVRRRSSQQNSPSSLQNSANPNEGANSTITLIHKNTYGTQPSTPSATIPSVIALQAQLDKISQTINDIGVTI